MRALRFCAAAALALAASAAAAEPSPHVGLKKTVAVESFQAGDSTGGATTGEGLAAMLAEALVGDGRFVVVERGALQAIQNEQTLGANGSATAGTGASRGQMIGASYLIRGTVTKYDPNHGGSSLSLGGIGPASQLVSGALGLKTTSAYIALSLRVIDSTTGQVISTVKADGVASSRDITASITSSKGPTVSQDALKNTPLGQAAEAAIHRALASLDAGLDRAPWSALVVENDDGRIAINAGADQDIHVGLTLHVIRKGKVLTDPGTGEVLDVAFTPVATMVVTRVSDRVAFGRMIDGEPPVRGDILRN